MHGKMKLKKGKIQEIFFQKLSKKKQEKVGFLPKMAGDQRGTDFMPGTGHGKMKLNGENKRDLFTKFKLEKQERVSFLPKMARAQRGKY